MFRRLVIGLGAFTLVLGSLAGSAAAQEGQCTYNNTVVACASPTPSSSLADAFATEGGPSAEVVPTPVPTVQATDDADAPQLAFTGGESEVLAYAGSGMIAVGAIALAARRRLDQD